MHIKIKLKIWFHNGANMYKHLIDILTKQATSVIKSQTTNSMYFMINGLKVRISDHYSDNSDYDLAIIKVIDRYLCIPNKVMFREHYPCSNVKQILDYIRTVSHSKRLNTPANQKIKQEHNVLRLKVLGINIKSNSPFEHKVLSLPETWIEVIEDYYNRSLESHQTKQSRIANYIMVFKTLSQFKERLFKTLN